MGSLGNRAHEPLVSMCRKAVLKATQVNKEQWELMSDIDKELSTPIKQSPYSVLHFITVNKCKSKGKTKHLKVVLILCSHIPLNNKAMSQIKNGADNLE